MFDKKNVPESPPEFTPSVVRPRPVRRVYEIKGLDEKLRKERERQRKIS
jgi:hypothetical protein